jgi:ABC-type multidrug transport system ATPase subunit
LHFERGKCYALIGENGSSKTTLIRIIAGLLKPDTGEVKNVFTHSMGYMPQSPYIFDLSVKKNVEMALSKFPDADQLAINALAAIGMKEMTHARGCQLSGGEAQRIAFARMIAIPRRLILLDEPTSSIDIRNIDQIEDTLLRYVADTGCLVIFSTHSPAQALRLAEETIFLEKGEINLQGPSQDVLKNPKTDAARFFLQHWKF